MRIAAVSSRVEDFGLTRPYTIAFQTADSVENVVARLETEEGLVGLGAASPEPRVTGETLEACVEALGPESLAWLVGRDARTLPALCRELSRRLPAAPAARAAVDMALHDLLARRLGVPVVEMLGRAHDALPTSITIGIKGVEETLAEAGEYVGRGFRILKVKTGRSLEEDLERLRRLREEFSEETVRIRADANQGYTAEQTLRFFRETERLRLEFLEQPVRADRVETLRSFPEAVRDRIAADESLLSDRDAFSLAVPPRAAGIFNIKLMKCGGIASAMRIAAVAELAGIEVMWGCMDESAVSIAAALHAALASPATRYLDLDGSLDLARDVVRGGFVLENGMMRTTQTPGLGVEAI
ncbi:MAG: mandelate racemase/muconate lactonizing enzyme family protein [Acidobacteriota bacterium]